MTSTGFEGVRTAKVDGATLAYREQGEGEPVLFVHGGVSDLRIWANQLSVVGRSHRAISYSRRFARPNENIDPEAEDPWLQHVDDLAVFLREIDAAPAHLVGNSQGAYVSLLAAIRYPKLVRSLVLEEPPVLPLFVGFPPRPTELLGLLATRPRTAIAILQFVLGTVSPATRAFERGEDDKGLEIFTLGVLGKETVARLPEESRQRARDNVSTLRAGMLHDIGFPPLEDDDVRGVRVPVLLMTGDRSPAFLLRLTDRLEELFPIVERIDIPDASHAMHEENPPAVNEAIVEFLGRHRAG
jgi:pimeloyl-ACP methyl ester carboxylesterase